MGVSQSDVFKPCCGWQECCVSCGSVGRGVHTVEQMSLNFETFSEPDYLLSFILVFVVYLPLYSLCIFIFLSLSVFTISSSVFTVSQLIFSPITLLVSTFSFTLHQSSSYHSLTARGAWLLIPCFGLWI